MIPAMLPTRRNLGLPLGINYKRSRKRRRRLASRYVLPAIMPTKRELACRIIVTIIALFCIVVLACKLVVLAFNL